MKRSNMAIDYVNIPYYGERKYGDRIKTKPKQETIRFYAYASIIYNIKKINDYTLAEIIFEGETLKDKV
jgi:hypothetical protein